MNEIDIGALYKRVGAEERKLVRDLLEVNPKEALVVAELLHYFPGTTVEPQSREGAPLIAVVHDMFPGFEDV